MLLCAAMGCMRLGAQPAVPANPMLEMVGREPCGVYFDRYEAICDSLFSGDSLAREHLVRMVAEAAALDRTGAWELDRQRLAGHVRFYRSRRGGYTPSTDYTAEQFAGDLLGIARAAEIKGLEIIRLRALFNAAAVYRIFAQDYERAFACYLEAAEGAMAQPLAKFPWKSYLYLEIADFYFSFREYEDAARFYLLIADDAEMRTDIRRLCPALNGLGLCYRYAERYDQSDSCFRRIISLAEPHREERRIWEGIAEGNLGYNLCLRGDFDGALARMRSALGKMKRPDDDPFTSQLAANIAAIHLSRGETDVARRYLATALDYHRRSRLPAKSSSLLQIMARYRIMLGDRREAAALLDSTIMAKEREQQAFSGLVLRRVEQQLRAADRKVHAERLGAEQMRSRMYRDTAVMVACALAVILMLLILVTIYYRRTRKAYRELVRRSQRWAGVETLHPQNETPETPETPEQTPQQRACERMDGEETAADDDGREEDDRKDAGQNGAQTCPDEALNGCAKEPARTEAFDREIMHAVEQAVVEGKMYKLADLTLDMLAAETGYSRYYLSGALNRCTGVNFNSYVNEQRVKEAVRLMSDPANTELTVDAVAFDAGFNDRKNFYRVFKKITGLSPTQFRRNLSE